LIESTPRSPGGAMNRPHAVLPCFARVGLLALLVGSAVATSSLPADAFTWAQYGGNPQHTPLPPRASQPFGGGVWQTPVDLNPQYDGTILYIHYGCPLSTAGNTILVPVKVGVSDSFRVVARSGVDGSLRWQLDSDYRLATPYNWTPSYGPVLTP